MNSQIDIVKPALNPMSPQATATMVKVDRGYLIAYGGTMCIQTPFESDIDCAFSPEKALPFFRKKRKTVAYTVKKNKLVIKSGKEQLTVPCVPGEEMPILDVIAPEFECEFNKEIVKHACKTIIPDNPNTSMQGIKFEDGFLWAGSGQMVIGAESALPDGLSFVLPLVACQYLAKAKQQIVAIATQPDAVKFFFNDGTTMCSRLLPDKFPDVAALFKGDFEDLKISKKLREDLLSLKCDSLEFYDGHVYYNVDTALGKN